MSDSYSSFITTRTCSTITTSNCTDSWRRDREGLCFNNSNMFLFPLLTQTGQLHESNFLNGWRENIRSPLSSQSGPSFFHFLFHLVKSSRSQFVNRINFEDTILAPTRKSILIPISSLIIVRNVNISTCYGLRENICLQLPNRSRPTLLVHLVKRPGVLQNHINRLHTMTG